MTPSHPRDLSSTRPPSPRDHGIQRDHGIERDHGAPESLGAILRAAADGRFPPVDGLVDVVPPYLDGVEAVVSFTGHAVIATTLPLQTLLDAGADGFAGATSIPVMTRLLGEGGTADVLDALLVARGTGGGTLPPRPDLEGHPRAGYARAWRREVRVFADDRGLVTLSRGLGGLLEVSFEVDAASRGAGLGRQMLGEALALAPAGEPVLAAVAPGNAASLRALLAARFTPIGSVQLVRPSPTRSP
jgi:GNAT superfamily N-acetyltransferase